MVERAVQGAVVEEFQYPVIGSVVRSP